MKIALALLLAHAVNGKQLTKTLAEKMKKSGIEMPVLTKGDESQYQETHKTLLRNLYTTTNGGTGYSYFYSDEEVCECGLQTNCDEDTGYYTIPAGKTVGSCLTCGYGGFDSNEDCYNCPTGYQIAVIFDDCTGYCILPADEADFTAAGMPPMATSDCVAYGSEYPLSCAAADCSSGCVGETVGCDDKKDDDDDVCFSGDSTVQLASGATKTMADLEVGDSVLSADATGKFSYSDVAFKPHTANAKAATFVKVTTESGKAVTATPTHLLASCEGGLVQAKAASCLKTVNGNEAVTSVETFKGKGIYSAVTLDNEFLVVDGVVASPFAMAHGLVNAYYNLHRAVYKKFPSLMKMPAVVSVNSLLAAGAIFAMNAVTASEK